MSDAGPGAPRRVALFGGSFNPPHVAHQMVALYVLETQPIDELWFVPTYAHPFGKPLVAYEHRVVMCELAAAALGPRVQVSRAEAELAERPGFVASHTLDLIDHIAAAGHALRLVVGADILHEVAKWHRWTDVVARAPLIVVGRGGHALPPGATGGEVAMPEVSATQIRELLARGDSSVAGLVPRDVLRYIAQHHLYQP
ncbi:MAG: nicotinate (nicotinamide) nucleotide adenylyltransferase [Deltaproteobacteria bacterium]|nr:MAG: nicotinate (nicotinamide) nucleotide adenylyltransferase [Deltaproteobacteria bacterium]TMQ24640.1 MAG: nicotinate (nicotinamide) nucleotide adenylyltransferase [Deltaproteobacteria bacterium]